MKILIVEDNADDRKILRYTLEKYACEVIEAKDGVEGLEMARAQKPDLIISDALMPRMDGFNLLRSIKTDEDLKSIPFIFYSAVYTGYKEVELAVSIGADAFIIKPKDPQELWDELEGILEKCKIKKEPSALTAELIKEDEEYLRRYGSVVAAKLEEKLEELNKTVAELTKAKEELSERARDAALGSEIGSALIQGKDLRSLLQLCAESIAKHLEAAFARIWTLNEKENVLELQASAGMYMHLNGTHSRVPVGKFKIGLIAEERKPHLTNDVLNDPRISDPEWARREGMVAFAGYPLIIADRLVGVMAMFSRNPLREAALTALASIADEIALGIERKLTERSLEEQKKFSDNLLENSAVAAFVLSAEHKVISWNRACEELSGVPASAVIGTNHQWKGFYERARPVLADLVMKSDIEKCPGLYSGIVKSTLAPNALHAEGWFRNLNGKDRYILFDAAPIYDSRGDLIAAIETLQDITERKQAEEEVEERVRELEKFYELAVDRELKMKELKEEMAKLKAEIENCRQ